MLVFRSPHVSWRQQTGLVYGFTFESLCLVNMHNLDLDPIGAIIVGDVSRKPSRS